MSTQSDVTFTLSGDAALVLDAALADLTELPIRLNRPAELAALWELEGALERCLVVTFAPDYDEALDAARRRIAEQAGLTSNARLDSTPSARWTCCFCGNLSSNGDGVRIQLQVLGNDEEAQALRAHSHCLRSHVHSGVPLLGAP